MNRPCFCSHAPAAVECWSNAPLGFGERVLRLAFYRTRQAVEPRCYGLRCCFGGGVVQLGFDLLATRWAMGGEYHLKIRVAV